MSPCARVREAHGPTHCPSDTVVSQLEEQSDQLEKLKRELEAKAGELAHTQEALSRTEQVQHRRAAVGQAHWDSQIRSSHTGPCRGSWGPGRGHRQETGPRGSAVAVAPQL